MGLTGYKRTEVGTIPHDWHVVPLWSTAKRITRGASPRPIGSPLWFDDRSSIGWVRISDVTRSRRYLEETTQRLSDAGIRSSRFVGRGGLIMSICATVGRPIETRVDSCIHDGFVVFEEPTIDQSFLYHVLASLEPTWSRRGQTGSQMNLNTGLIKGRLVVIPSTTSEQRVIAAALDDVDALLDGLDRIIAKKRDLKQAVMQQLLTGQTRLPGFRGEWRETRLGDYVTFLRNGVNSRAELLPAGRVKYIHYGDVHACKDVYLSTVSLPCLPDAKAASLDRLQDGDLIFADASEDVGGVSKSVEVREVGSTEVVSGLHTIAARFDKDVLADGFKGFLQFSPPFVTHLRRLAAGTKVYATNRAHIAGVEMPLPPVREQVAIATDLSDMDAEIAALENRRDKTHDLKQAMMQVLLTGKTRLVQPEAAHA